METVTTTEVAENLKGLLFPCRRRDCVQFVREHEAPDKVVSLVERMPDRRLDCMADVWAALGKVA
ncbi:MAG: DUF2795 domain-containing protein [Chloroflexota bacterium]